jgi:hypothetical protein
MRELRMSFYGPFGWGADKSIPSIYDSEHSDKAGIYIWTVLTTEGDELAWYVGETGRSFAKRFREHQHKQAIGSYNIYEPEKFILGQKIRIWGGKYGPTREPELDFNSRFERVKETAARFMQTNRFHVAPIQGDPSGILGAEEFRSRAEAGLAHHFYTQEGVVGKFIDNVEYLKESRLGMQWLSHLRWPPPDASTRLVCHSQGRIRCFPREIII